MKDRARSVPDLLRIGVLLFLLAFLSRAAGIARSWAATDIVYAEGALPSLMGMLRQFLVAALLGCAVGAAAFASSRRDARRARAVIWLAAAAELLDAVGAFCVDWIGGAVYGEMLWLAAGQDLLDVVWNTALLWIAYWFIRRTAERSVKKAILLGAAVFLAGSLIPETVHVIGFLIEVEFSPYTREVTTILGEYLGYLFSGGVLWLSGLGIAYLCERRAADSRSIHQ